MSELLNNWCFITSFTIPLLVQCHFQFSLLLFFLFTSGCYSINNAKNCINPTDCTFYNRVYLFLKFVKTLPTLFYTSYFILMCCCFLSLLSFCFSWMWSFFVISSVDSSAYKRNLTSQTASGEISRDFSSILDLDLFFFRIIFNLQH